MSVPAGTCETDPLAFAPSAFDGAEDQRSAQPEGGKDTANNGRAQWYGNSALKRALRLIKQTRMGSLLPREIAEEFLHEAAWVLELAHGGALDLGKAEQSLRAAYVDVLPEELDEVERRMNWVCEHGRANPRRLADRHGKRARAPKSLLVPASESRTGRSEGSASGHGDAQEPQTQPVALPVVRLEDGERDTVGGIVDKIERALADDMGGPDPVFQRGGALVHITTPRRGGKVRRDPRATVIGLASVPFLARRAGRCLTFEALRGRGGARDWTRVDLPKSYAEFVHALGSWPNIPVLEGVIYTPTLRPDGSLLARPGYDQETGLLADFQGVCFPDIPEKPTRDDAERALERLAQPLRGFPFVHERYKAVSLAAIMTALVRRSLPTAPAFGFSAPVRASGKTLLAKIASAIATGRDPAAMPTGRDGEELRKRLFAVLLAGDPVVLVDNIDRPLESAEFCAILTGETYADRVLGVSRTVEVPTAATFLLTGNHLALRGDLESRVLLSKIDPRAEFPEQRTFNFDPVEEALRDRADLAAAGLVVMRAFIAAGRPKVATPASRFPVWARIVRNPLVWLGMPDPVDTAHEAELDDTERAAVSHVLLKLAERFPGRDFTLADAKGDGLWPVLAEAIGPSESELTAKAAGNFLATFVDRVVVWREGSPSRSLVLRVTGITHGRRRWRVEEVT